jgi:hypothetical protein
MGYGDIGRGEMRHKTVLQALIVQQQKAEQ